MLEKVLSVDGAPVGKLDRTPYRLIERGPRLLLVPNGWPKGQHIAEINPFRDDGFELGLGLCAAVADRRELVAALRLLSASVTALQTTRSTARLVDVMQANEVARDVLARQAA